METILRKIKNERIRKERKEIHSETLREISIKI